MMYKFKAVDTKNENYTIVESNSLAETKNVANCYRIRNPRSSIKFYEFSEHERKYVALNEVVKRSNVFN